VVFEFPEPNYLFIDILAGSTSMGGGQAREQHQGRNMGAYMPAHFLRQFHPKYVAQDELDRKAKAAGFDGWVSLIKGKWDWRLTPELPVLAPWKTVSPINTPTWGLERNPYYYGVDIAGNQLPYLDRISMGLAENLEVLNLRAIAGQYDLQGRHTNLAKLPVFLENRAKGGYEVRLDPAAHGSDATLQTNQSYEADLEVATWLQTREFRRALSMGIDRGQLNEAFWLGLGVPGSHAPAENMPESPGPEWRTKWCTYNPKQANEFLDKIGLAKKDGEGYRLRTDGKGRLRIEILTPAGSIIPYTQVGEVIREQWRKIGIQTDVKEVERSLFFTKIANNEHHIALWVSDGSEQIYLFPRYALPVDPAQSLLGQPLAGTPATAPRASRQRIRSCSKCWRCSGRRQARRRSSGASWPKTSGRSWWTSSGASGRSASRRRHWVCASSASGWVTYPHAR
jgi:peptide/nickel transport system substrate-binding protein